MHLIFRGLFGLTLLFGACLTPTATSPQRDSNPGTAQDFSPHSPAPRLGTTYEQLPFFSKVLYYVTNHHVRPWQMPWIAFENAVKAVTREVPGMSVERQGSRLTARLGTQSWQAKQAEVDAPWTMRAQLQRLFGWLAPQLTPKDGLSTDQQLARLEVSAANGLLLAIDAHSVLLPPAQSREYVAQKPQRAGSIGLIVRSREFRGRTEFLRRTPSPEVSIRGFNLLRAAAADCEEPGQGRSARSP
jgi:hypothetical protein